MGVLQSVIHSTVFILFILSILRTLNISVYLRPSLNIDMSVSPLNKTISWSPLHCCFFIRQHWVSKTMRAYFKDWEEPVLTMHRHTHDPDIMQILVFTVLSFIIGFSPFKCTWVLCLTVSGEDGKKQGGKGWRWTGIE